MFKITETNCAHAKPYPYHDEDDYLHNFEDSDIGSLLSTMGIQSIVGNNVFRLGDSKVVISILDTSARQCEGMELLTQAAKDLAELIKKALPQMSSEEYKAFYRFMLNDFETNGLVMATPTFVSSV